MTKTLSIIIPMYNSAPFINKCIDSLILPNPLMEQIEILVVNDGSTDACEELVKPYTRDYPESVFLYNKENGGHGSVINYAIPFCHGKYVKVLDADDWFQTRELEKLITCLQTEKPADLILTPFLTFDLSTQSYAAIGATNQAHRITMSQIIKHWSYCKRICCFHGLTYRTEFYKKYAFMLPEKVFYDDAFYCTLPAYMAKRITIFPIPVYVYRIGDINQSVSVKSRVARIRHHEAVIEQMLKSFQRTSQEEQNEYYYRKTTTTLADYMITALLRFPNRREGRTLAKKMLMKIKASDYCVYRHIYKKYVLLKAANLLKLSEQTFMKFMRMFDGVLR